MKNHSLCFLLLAAAVLALSSCVSRKKTIYFQDIKTKADYSSKDTTRGTASADTSRYDANALTIQPFDVLDIKVANSVDALKNLTESRSTFTTPIAATGGGYFSSFLVDAHGNVTLPMVGDMNFRGLTLSEAKIRLRERMKDYLLDPYVDIKFLTFKVTFLGEVLKPGQVTISNERTNLIDALSYVGDLTDNGNRKNILILRGDIQHPISYTVDLTDTKTFASPGFQLKPNDIVYVEPLKRKFLLLNLGSTISVLALVNTVLLVANFLRR